MSSPSRVQIAGPLARFAEGFAAELIRQGYRPAAAASQLQLIAHLSRWLAPKRLDVEDLTASLQKQFLTSRRSQGYKLLLSPKALAPFMEYARGLGLAPVTTASPSPIEEFLARYGRYLLDTRGLAEKSARGYIDMVRPFVAAKMVDGSLNWEGMKRSTELSKFILRMCQNRSRRSASLLITALRSLLNYLHIEGLIEGALSSAVPSVACSKLAGLPRYMEPSEVEHLLAACDQRTLMGRRTFAMLMLLGRLGLRSGEVRALRLDDLDWRAGELIVQGKGSRIERLPLPPDVGEALAAYLRRDRPSTAHGRTVFVRVRAPHRPLTGGGVANAVQTAASNAGLCAVTAHRLRHTVATQMVRAGVPLPEIGQVLRHRRLLTTAIYAKVDRESLRRIARRWLGGAR